MFDFIPSSNKKSRIFHSRSQSQHTGKISTHREWPGEEQCTWQHDLEEPASFRHQKHTHSSAQAALAPPLRTHHSSQAHLPRPGLTEISSSSGSTHNPTPCHSELHSRISSATRSHRPSSQNSPPELLLDPWTDRQLSIGSTAPTKSSTQRLKKRSSRIISEWFNGESAPIQLGPVPSPSREKEDPMETPANKPSLVSRFSFFTGKSQGSKRPSSPPQLHDEFIDLDIPSALAVPTDPLSLHQSRLCKQTPRIFSLACKWPTKNARQHCET